MEIKPRIGLPVRPSISAAAKYREELERLVLRTAAGLRRELIALFESPVATQDASLGSQARITANALIAKYQKLFDSRSRRIAEEMVRRVDRDASSKFTRSLREMSGDLTLTTKSLQTGALNDVLKASVAENVQLIKSIGSRYLDSVQQSVMQAVTTGQGLAELVPALRRHEGVSSRRAKLIAYDQVRKVTANVSKARAEANGLTKYRWVHSGGGKEPRPLHVSYSGEVFRYDDPPIIDERTGERGGPGVAINCRCVAVPILEF